MQSEETNQQIARTSSKIELLREQQAELTRTVLAFITSQDELNVPIQRKIDELLIALQRTRQEVQDVIKAINNLINLSSKTGNTPQE